MRVSWIFHACCTTAALTAVVPPCAAQETPCEEQPAPGHEEEPEPDPGGLDIQFPQPRLFAMATLGNGSEYRDRLLSDRNLASLAGGVAWRGFSASGLQSWELSTGKTANELLLGYSYKLPFIDAHAGYVVCGNDRMLGGCPDGVRLTLTSNSIARTTIEASFDLAVSSNRRSVSASVTRDLWDNGETSGAVRAGWTRTDYGGAVHLDGASLRLIASRRLSKSLAFDVAIGSAWTSGRAKLPGARDGIFATTSLVWRN